MWEHTVSRCLAIIIRDPGAIELLVNKQKALKIIRKRETLEELLANEMQLIFESMKIKVFYYYLLCIYCISGCPLVFAEKSMYKNSINGITSFSDRQTAESEIIILDNKRNLISTEPTENRPNFDSQTSSNINTGYNVEILNIKNEQTFRNIQNLK